MNAPSWESFAFFVLSVPLSGSNRAKKGGGSAGEAPQLGGSSGAVAGVDGLGAERFEGA